MELVIEILAFGEVDEANMVRLQRLLIRMVLESIWCKQSVGFFHFGLLNDHRLLLPARNVLCSCYIHIVAVCFNICSNALKLTKFLPGEVCTVPNRMVWEPFGCKKS